MAAKRGASGKAQGGQAPAKQERATADAKGSKIVEKKANKAAAPEKAQAAPSAASGRQPKRKQASGAAPTASSEAASPTKRTRTRKAVDARETGPTSPTKHGRATNATTANTEPDDDRSEGPHYFLLKSEPHEFGIEHLAVSPDQTSQWDGVRNFRARNLLQSMRQGDLCFFYHSSCKQTGIAGIVEVVKEAYPDYTAWDPSSKYFDPKSPEDKPRWFMVNVRLVKQWDETLLLQTLREHQNAELEGMVLFGPGRLSVQPVTPQHWEFIQGLAKQAAHS